MPCIVAAQDLSTNQGTGTATLSQPSADGGRETKHGRWTENLSAAERKQLKAAHDAAIRENPSLTQMMEEARQKMEAAKKALNAAMIKVDPDVESLLEKIHPQRDTDSKTPLSQPHSNR